MVRRIAHKTAYHCMGWSFIAIGMVGIVAPLIPGIIFLALGVYVLSLTSLWFYNKLESVKVRHPRFAFYFNKLEAKFSKFFKKIH